MTDKNALRRLYKSIRQGINVCEKTDFDNIIFTKLINTQLYRNASIILVYVSYNSEVDTEKLIEYSLEIQKTVAVPYCNGDKMDFYIIKSSDELIPGKYGIPTVDINNRIPLDNFNNALCIVPALSYDLLGNRLGYGGGYYDRFLASNNIKSIGLCYSRCIHSHLPAENFDIKVDIVLTENF